MQDARGRKPFCSAAIQLQPVGVGTDRDQEIARLVDDLGQVLGVDGQVQQRQQQTPSVVPSVQLVFDRPEAEDRGRVRPKRLERASQRLHATLAVTRRRAHQPLLVGQKRPPLRERVLHTGALERAQLTTEPIHIKLSVMRERQRDRRLGARPLGLKPLQASGSVAIRP
jgi:hypothetical protein